MIVSHRHRYLFVQFPRSACTAIGDELVRHYDGTPILNKHAALHDFYRHTNGEGKDYSIFSSIRNPFDEVVSFYFKIKNQRDVYEDQRNWIENGGWINPRIRRQYRYVQANDCSFEDYLRTFYHWPYVNWSVLDHKRMDYVIRYERLQLDFAEVLRRLGLEQVRPLPWENRTAGVRRDKDVLFPSGSVDVAVHTLGPMMRYWGYDFPFEIGYRWPSFADRVRFRAVAEVKKLYWRNAWHLTRGRRLAKAETNRERA